MCFHMCVYETHVHAHIRTHLIDYCQNLSGFIYFLFPVFLSWAFQKKKKALSSNSKSVLFDFIHQTLFDLLLNVKKRAKCWGGENHTLRAVMEVTSQQTAQPSKQPGWRGHLWNGIRVGYGPGGGEGWALLNCGLQHFPLGPTPEILVPQERDGTQAFF